VALMVIVVETVADVGVVDADKQGKDIRGELTCSR
jgi:hypothetical protein